MLSTNKLIGPRRAGKYSGVINNHGNQGRTTLAVSFWGWQNEIFPFSIGESWKILQVGEGCIMKVRPRRHFAIAYCIATGKENIEVSESQERTKLKRNRPGNIELKAILKEQYIKCAHSSSESEFHQQWFL